MPKRRTINDLDLLVSPAGTESIEVQLGDLPLGEPRRIKVSDVLGGGGASLPVVDTTSIVEGSVDDTKELRFEVDTLTTGTVRVATWPDQDGTIMYADTVDSLTNKDINDFSNFVAADEQHIQVFNNTGSLITLGSAVYVSGFNVGQDAFEITLADADNAAAMPAVGLVEADITNGSTGSVVTFGKISGLNTVAYTEGAPLYVSTTPGLLTDTRPTGDTVQVQKVAIVSKSNASGRLLVVGAGRSNDIPNRMDDALVRIHSTGDATKLLQFSAANITTATTRTLTMADADVDLANIGLGNLADIATDTFLGRVTAATGAVEVLTNAQAKTALDLTGTNSGDQTSMSGISDTKANFNTALNDGAFIFVGDPPTAHTHLLSAGATDVTASATELNLLDLAGLTAGWVLSADTATTASWKAPTGGGGDVTKVGTPVDNQIGVWTGDGTIEGDAGLTWDGAGVLNIIDAVNDGNPFLLMGASAAERLEINPIYETGTQLLDRVHFVTKAASATADRGLFRFLVDEAAILDINDSGLSVTGSVLAGNLSLATNTLSSTDTNGNINLTPDGTGNVALGNYTLDGDQTVGAGQDNYVLKYDFSSGLISLEADATGAGSVSFGSENTIPSSNAGGTDFDYDATFLFDGAHMSLGTVGDSISVGQAAGSFDFAGTTRNVALLATDSTVTDVSAALFQTGASSTTGGAQLVLGQDDGAAMASGHRLGAIHFVGADDATSELHIGASIRAEAAELWDATGHGTSLSFDVIDDNELTVYTPMVLRADGNVDFGVVGGNGSHLFVREGSVAASSKSQYGQYWVKTAVPSQPYFTGDTGVDQRLGDVLKQSGDAGDETDHFAIFTSDNETIGKYNNLTISTPGLDVVFQGWHLILGDDAGGGNYAGEMVIHDTWPKATMVGVNTGSSSTEGPEFWMARKQASALATNNRLGNIDFRGSDDGTTSLDPLGARISANNTQAWTTSAWGAKLEFRTTPNSSITNTLALTIGQDQALTAESTLYMLERADSLGDVAGYSQVWAKTGTPSELWFTADDGTSSRLDNQAGGDMVLADVQTVTGAKTFGTIGGTVDKFILAGSTSGSSILNAAAVAGSTTLVLPGVSDTLAGIAATQTITNKTIDGDNNTLSNLDLGNEVDWAVIGDVSDRTAFTTGDKVLIFEAGVGMRKVDYDDLPGAGGGANTNLSNLTATAINLSLISDTDITDDLGTEALRWRDVYAATLNTGQTAADTLKLRGYDVDGAAFVDILTVTANNTVTADLHSSVTHGSLELVDVSGAQTLTDKTLTSPRIGTSILDTNGNELFILTATGSAVNEVTYANAATGNDPTFTASGETNVGISLQGKGTGNITLGNYVFDGDQTVGAGTDNYVLTYDHASTSISLEAATGGGNVSNTGTPADSQIPVWTNATTIEGTANLTYDGLTLDAGNYSFDTNQTVGAGQDNYVLTYDNGTGEISLEAAAGGGGAATDMDLDSSPDTDHTGTGIRSNDINAGMTITIMNVVVLAADGKWDHADASTEAGGGGMLALALAAGTDTNPLNVLKKGYARDDTWAWTIGADIWLSETAGGLTETPPTAEDTVVRKMGHAVTADVIWFEPSTSYIVNTADAGSTTVLAYDKISEETLSGDGNFAAVTIPAGYDALELHFNQFESDRAAAATDQIWIEINDDTTTANYEARQLIGITTTTQSAWSGSDRTVGHCSAATDTGKWGTQRMRMYNISDTSKETTWETTGGGGGIVGTYGGIWENTSAVTKIEITPGVGTNFKSGSNLQIWGRKSVGVVTSVSSDLAWTTIATPNANKTGVVGQIAAWNISTFTADRDFTLPSTAAVDELVGIHLTTGDDTYEVNIKTDAAGSLLEGQDAGSGLDEYRLFLTGERMVFRCIKAGGAGDTDWIVEQDGRIPCTVRATLSANITTNTAAANTDLALDTEDEDNANIYDNSTNYKITTRRKARWNALAYARPVNSVSAAQYYVVRLLDSSSGIWAENIVSGDGGAVIQAQAEMNYREVSLGNDIKPVFQSQASDRGADSTGEWSGFEAHETFR